MFELITNHLYLIRGENDGRFPFGHSVLIIEQDNKGTLLDTGCGIEILRNLKQKFVITRIINSHTHPDHCARKLGFQRYGTGNLGARRGFSVCRKPYAAFRKIHRKGPSGKVLEKARTGTRRISAIFYLQRHITRAHSSKSAKLR